MKTSALNFGTPKELEAKRIAAIKSLSYLERLERLMAIIEVSYMLKSAKRYTLKSKNDLEKDEFK
jgi:hypothetical protein